VGSCSHQIANQGPGKQGVNRRLTGGQRPVTPRNHTKCSPMPRGPMQGGGHGSRRGTGAKLAARQPHARSAPHPRGRHVLAGGAWRPRPACFPAAAAQPQLTGQTQRHKSLVHRLQQRRHERSARSWPRPLFQLRPRRPTKTDAATGAAGIIQGGCAWAPCPPLPRARAYRRPGSAVPSRSSNPGG
jgi:hypothetical protein